MMTKLQSYLRRYLGEERGSIAIETVLVIPALFWAYLALFATFDAYRQYSITQKAAFTVGDMVSRETAGIDAAYLTGMRDLVKYITNTKEDADVSVRISTLWYDADNDVYKRDWSKTRGNLTEPLTNGEVADWHDRLPILPDNERITVVETFVRYDPPFDTGLSERTIRNFVFTKPRYAPQVYYNEDETS